MWSTLCLGPAILGLVVFALSRVLIIMLQAGNVIGGYVVVSPEGLEIQTWPLYQFGCAGRILRSFILEALMVSYALTKPRLLNRMQSRRG